ncbi:DUF1517 domain-containing protein [Tumidithrix elongata RA019]|uniref:DUF1517 domain-containing protein n=1 Tax=Tumidithrix elongata BACA0141 TaxID=2716417 RepID=A0AAW9Q8Q3_9CYAN|nr:DUF1517 domain-containing protein [Tumidithrix elongata RA019]
MRKTKFQFLAATLLAFSTVQAIDLGFGDFFQDASHRQLNTFLQLDRQANAKSSAGRTRSGSFNRSTPSNSGSSSPTRSSDPSTPSRSNDRDSFSPSQPSNGGNPIIAPVIINNNNSRPYSTPGTYQSSTSSSDEVPWFVWLIVLLIGGSITYFIIRAIFFRNKSKGAAGDLGNDTFTVTKLQVALLAQAREVQARLTELSLEVDTDTPDGLMTLLQESAIALIRTPENWTHVSSSSQPVKRDKAEELFNKLSLEERSKFSEETLVNVGGRRAVRQAAIASLEKDPSAYIVVTLLIGTEHDKPLFGEIRNTEELRKALEAIAAIPASHLLIFELLWSPQADSDSLTYDELLTEYSNMIQI